MGRNMVPGILCALGGLAAILVGAPWWCIVLITFLALAAGVVQTVFPHDSQDKLRWWTNRRSYLGRRHQLRMLKRTGKRSD
ncbi:hypothetical protein ACTVZO_31240 [Streptomyces sp. IBSNAI002]|uniref:hypothetical protein n=1 Tax=Streptomyces sp. IBSNAI002 TaxID=3457500 RepID=UPI003FD1B5A9